MKNKQVFIAHYCENNNTSIEESLIDKDYIITRKKCSGVKVLRYVIREKPDLCILKSAYEDIEGLKIIKEALKKNSKTKFILVFKEINEIDIVVAMQFNVFGCISCNDGKYEVLTCLDKVHNNERYLSKEIYDKIDEDQLSNYTNFTEIQTKIIAYIGFYISSEKIAKKLNISITSVNKEINFIKKQLRLGSNQPLYLWAVKNTNFIEALLVNKFEEEPA
ncbi:hypothetical protein SCB49_04730 [unidentified eubacterium SCB49]|nr:hypothetical protein SCB49_04730 [unidentified eubacterium SCB49]